eukprot:6485194-Amphidinium_carterae.2
MKVWRRLLLHPQGACHDMNLCRPKYDSIDGVCEEERYRTLCPCKNVWSVLGEFEGHHTHCSHGKVTVPPIPT